MHPNAQQFKNCWVILLRETKNLAAKKKEKEHSITRRRRNRSIDEHKGWQHRNRSLYNREGEKTGEVVILMMTFRHHIQKQDT